MRNGIKAPGGTDPGNESRLASWQCLLFCFASDTITGGKFTEVYKSLHSHAHAREGAADQRGAPSADQNNRQRLEILRHRSPANRTSQRSEAQQLRPEILREILAHREQLRPIRCAGRFLA